MSEEPAPLPPDYTPPFSKWMPWVVLASLLVVTALFTQLYMATRAENAVYAQEQQLSDVEAKSLRNQLEAERILTREQVAFFKAQSQPGATATSALKIFLMSSPERPGVIATAVWDGAHYEGVLVTRNLGPAPAGQAYHLWLIEPQTQLARNAGAIVITDADKDSNFTFKSGAPIPSPGTFVLSLEPAGDTPPSGIGQIVLKSR